MLAVAKIEARLTDRFRLLTSGRRDALPHQQTLRQAIDWSYDLLDDHQRVLLRRLRFSAAAAFWNRPKRSVAVMCWM